MHVNPPAQSAEGVGLYVQSLADFVRSRPPQPVSAFLEQSNAVLTHDVESQLERIAAPTLITFGRDDFLTSARFADRLAARIRGSRVVAFDGCSHAPLYEKVQEFNSQTLAFLRRSAETGVAW